MSSPLEHLKLFSDPSEPLTAGHWICVVAKRHKYLTLSIENRYDPNALPHYRFTIHQAEAKKLAEAILKAATAPVDPTLSIKVLGSAEGIYIGGPVEPEGIIDPSMGFPGGQENIRKASEAKEALENVKPGGA